MVNGFAPMIREVVRTQRMPPWHADPHYGSSRTTARCRRTRSRRWCTGSKPAHRAAAAAIRSPSSSGPGPSGSSASPISSSRCRHSTCRRRARSRTRCRVSTNPLDHDVGCARSISCRAIAPCSITSSRRSAARRRHPRRRRLGGFVPGDVPMFLPRRHRRADREGREVRLPDALHRDRQGGRDVTRMGLYFTKDRRSTSSQRRDARIRA